MQRSMNNNFFKQEKSDEDIGKIIASLKKAKAKYNEKTLVISKNDLVYKIVDNLNVPKAKAIEYLMIIQSRGIITIDKDIICFSPKSDEKMRKEAEQEAEKIIGNMGEPITAKGGKLE